MARELKRFKTPNGSQNAIVDSLNQEKAEEENAKDNSAL